MNYKTQLQESQVNPQNTSAKIYFEISSVWE